MRSGAAAGVAGVGAADGAARSQPASSEAWRWAPSLPRRTPTTDTDLAMAMHRTATHHQRTMATTVRLTTALGMATMAARGPGSRSTRAQPIACADQLLAEVRQAGSRVSVIAPSRNAAAIP